MKTVRLILAGLGFVNRGLIRILIDKEAELARSSGIRFKVTGVADSSGVALDTAGFSLPALLELKNRGDKAADLPGFSSGLRTEDFAGTGIGDVLVESTPANMIDGGPGLVAARNALLARVPVVFANKAPLVFAFDELHQLAAGTGGGPYETTEPVRIEYSATVCGGLPVVNVIRRDLRFAGIKRVRGIMNATTNYILEILGKGGDFDEAVREAQRIGAAEADPSYDINGNDTANKLFIVMKTIGGYQGHPLETSLTGIRNITAADLAAANSRGNTIKLVACAHLEDRRGWSLRVAPEEISADTFLGSCNGWEMGVEIESDLYERVCLKNYEADPLGTSAAVLRDVLSVVGEPSNGR
ncbi:MAG: homoserine dehydrogenase [Bacteroidota bacterium]